jgi:hypothetical protein
MLALAEPLPWQKPQIHNTYDVHVLQLHLQINTKLPVGPGSSETHSSAHAFSNSQQQTFL